MTKIKESSAVSVSAEHARSSAKEFDQNIDSRINLIIYYSYDEEIYWTSLSLAQGQMQWASKRNYIKY